MSNKKTLVIGATGQQGGAVARELLQAGESVSVLVRDVDAPKAQALAAAGATLVEGDLDSVSSITAAMDGMDRAFGVTTMMNGGVELETVHGKNIIAAAEQAGLGHLVMSTVASADKATGIPHFDSKYEIEKALTESSVPWTITAPVFFHENLLFPWIVEGVKGGAYRQALPIDKPLQMVAVEDIGAVNAHILIAGKEFFGQRIDLASDELTGSQVASQLSAVLNREIAPQEQPVAEVRSQSEDMALMFEWFDRVGYDVDLGALHSRFPDVSWTPFAHWATTVYSKVVTGE